MTGEQFDRYRWVGPAAHFKLTIPNPGADDVDIPAPDPDDDSVSFGSNLRITRTYTARRFDEVTRHLDVDVVLHGEGPVSTWAEAVRPGGRLAVSVPRGAGFVQDDEVDWILLAGDASALPAIATIADVVSRPTTIYVEVDDATDQLGIARPVHWLTRVKGQPSGTALESAVSNFHRPAGRGQVWVAAEAAHIRRIRARLATELDRNQLVTRGYWREGERNHPDHDNGEGD